MAWLGCGWAGAGRAGVSTGETVQVDVGVCAEEGTGWAGTQGFRALMLPTF